MLNALEEIKRKNTASEVKINKLCLFTPVNDESVLPIKVLVMVKFSGLDELFDLKTDERLYCERGSGMVEFWHFIYDGKTLLLDDISQTTESSPHLVKELEAFAKEKGLFYSPDWGRLMLPTQGLIFTKRGLVTADVNNYILGQWGKGLVQLYTYSEKPAEPDSYFLVGQINVPKSYAGVIVEAKSSKYKVVKPEGYTMFEMEWGEFNKKYNVYAADEDALTAFELLNPKVIAMVYEKSLPYNLEVIGNTIYFFAKVSEAKEEDYAEMLEILADAFEILKI